MTDSKPENPQAFPLQHTDYTEGFAGMTLRDYFAAKSMEARVLATNQVLSDGRVRTPSSLEFQELRQNISESAYLDADAMLKARGN